MRIFMAVWYVVMIVVYFCIAVWALSAGHVWLSVLGLTAVCLHLLSFSMRGVR